MCHVVAFPKSSQLCFYSYCISWYLCIFFFLLADLLRLHQQCTYCNRPVFTYYKSSIKFKTIGVYFRLPLCTIKCAMCLRKDAGWICCIYHFIYFISMINILEQDVTDVDEMWNSMQLLKMVHVYSVTWDCS